MDKSISIELPIVANRSITDAVNSLHTLWTLVKTSLGTETDWAACELVHEMLPLIGGKLDAVVREMGGFPTGAFDDTLEARGIKFNAAPPAEAQRAELECEAAMDSAKP